MRRGSAVMGGSRSSLAWARRSGQWLPLDRRQASPPLRFARHSRNSSDLSTVPSTTTAKTLIKTMRGHIVAIIARGRCQCPSADMAFVRTRDVLGFGVFESASHADERAHARRRRRDAASHAGHVRAGGARRFGWRRSSDHATSDHVRAVGKLGEAHRLCLQPVEDSVGIGTSVARRRGTDEIVLDRWGTTARRASGPVRLRTHATP